MRRRRKRRPIRIQSECREVLLPQAIFGFFGAFVNMLQLQMLFNEFSTAEQLRAETASILVLRFEMRLK